MPKPPSALEQRISAIRSAYPANKRDLNSFFAALRQAAKDAAERYGRFLWQPDVFKEHRAALHHLDNVRKHLSDYKGERTIAYTQLYPYLSANEEALAREITAAARVAGRKPTTAGTQGTSRTRYTRTQVERLLDAVVQAYGPVGSETLIDFRRAVLTLWVEVGRTWQTGRPTLYKTIEQALDQLRVGLAVEHGVAQQNGRNPEELRNSLNLQLCIVI
ncbi:hypothetical protein JCM10908_002685 [Rhodotorula pacifica]|uniref:uncharacterized protein n=1 Tax=Rhodotorula pacifica TaxID=1495444 RepID=UPI00316E759B